MDGDLQSLPSPQEQRETINWVRADISRSGDASCRSVVQRPGARTETNIQAHQKQVDILLDIYRQPGSPSKVSSGSKSHGTGSEAGIIVFGEDRPVSGKAPLDPNAGRPTA